MGVLTVYLDRVEHLKDDDGIGTLLYPIRFRGKNGKMHYH